MSTINNIYEDEIFDVDKDPDMFSANVLLPEDCEQFVIENSTPSIASLMLDWQDNTLQIPEFQRGFVWDIKKASKFIESLLLKLPIPNLFFYRDKNQNNYIIDGQQRLKTIFYFMSVLSSNDLTDRERKFLGFRLQGLSPLSPWHNKTFSDENPLSEVDQRRLKKTPLNVVTISLTSDDGLKGVYHIFERLNTGGVILEPQEIRNCVYSGKFNDFLLELNTNEYWRKFITVDTQQSHQKDIELILRFFALYDNYKTYKKPMKDFLSAYMGSPSIRNITDNDLKIKRKLFNKTVQSIYKNLGERPFHIIKQINSAVCDSVMIAFANNLDNIPDDIYDKYYELTHNNSEYLKYISKSSTDNSSVYNRITLAEKFLFPKETRVYNQNGNKIKLYTTPVCAGSGFYIDSTSEFVDLYIDDPKVDYAVRIKGKSMSPQINNDDIALVSKTQKFKNGDIIIATYYNETMCKKVVCSGKNIFLKPINSRFKQYKITPDTADEFHCDGIVIGVINKQDLSLYCDSKF